MPASGEESLNESASSRRPTTTTALKQRRIGTVDGLKLGQQHRTYPKSRTGPAATWPQAGVGRLTSRRSHPDHDHR
jgi:hypothetical protein